MLHSSATSSPFLFLQTLFEFIITGYVLETQVFFGTFELCSLLSCSM